MRGLVHRDDRVCVRGFDEAESLAVRLVEPIGEELDAKSLLHVQVTLVGVFQVLVAGIPEVGVHVHEYGHGRNPRG